MPVIWIESPFTRFIVEKSPLISMLPDEEASNKPALVRARVAVIEIVPTDWYVSLVVVVVWRVDVPATLVSTSVNKVVSVIAAVPAPVPTAQ